MTRYAEQTKVPAQRSRAEIEATLERYGATGFLYGNAGGRALVLFEMCERRIKFVLPLPLDADYRTDNQYQQAIRQRWRALLLVIKAKLEAVESDIVTFDNEFMAHIVLPDGSTIGEVMAPQIASAYGTGEMPPLLPDYSNRSPSP